MGMHLQGAEFQASAKKEGAKAGEVAGAQMSKGISGALGKAKFGASIVQGFGIGIGVGAFHALTDAIGDVINAIPNMIRSGQDFARTVDDIGDATGSSAEEASRFAAALIYTNGTAAGASMGLKTLSKDLVANRAEFEKLGISITDANGAPRDTLAILEDVREFVATKLPAGYSKSALAIKLFGRSGLDFLDFLSMSNEQVGKFNSTVDAMGVTLSGPAVAAAEALAREQNLLGLAWQGLSNTLTTAVVPAIRSAIGGLTQFIVEHGAEIRQTLVDITQALLGFVSGLVGIEGISPFQGTLDELSGSGSDAALSFDQWAVSMGHTIPKVDKATGSTKAGTDAIDKQIKAVERRIDAAKRQDDAEETRFQRTMKRLSAEYGAQLDALDLQERQLAMAERDKDLSERLRQAKIDLFKAQAQRGADRTAGKADDPSGVVEAQQAVLDAQKAISDEAAQRDRDSQRARLEGVRTYIENVAQIEAESENKKALASTLEKRRIKLLAELATATEEGKAADIADINARLEAVKTAEARTQAAIKNGDKQSELGKLKAQLEEQRKAISAAGSGEVSDNAKKLDDLRAQYAIYWADQTNKTAMATGLAGEMILGDRKSGTGLGGAITKSFTDGALAGEAFRKFLTDDLMPAIEGVLGLFGKIKDTLDEIAESDVWKVLNEPIDVPGFVQDRIDEAERTGAGNRPLLGDDFPRRTEGGPVMRGHPFIGNERRQEFFVPSENGTVIPSLGAMAGVGGMGGQPVIVRIPAPWTSNGFIDWVDENLSYRRR